MREGKIATSPLSFVAFGSLKPCMNRGNPPYGWRAGESNILNMKIVQITTVLALTILALTGCAAFPNSSSGYDAGVFPYSSVEGQVDDLGSPEGISSRPESAVITTAYAFLTDEDPSRVADDIQTLTTSAGGKIDGRSVQSDPDGRTNYVSLTVRIPYGATDAFLADLDGVATVQSLNQNSQDVTLIVTDYEARISALETSIARFLALGKDARSTQDLIEIESALAERQAQLEQLQSEMRYYSDQIALSTVQVDIGLPDSATDPIPDDFWGGIVAGWKGLIAFFTGTLVAIGFAIPWIPVIAGLGWLGMWLVRRFVTRRSATSAPAKKSAKR
jgi:hypothetical protein